MKEFLGDLTVFDAWYVSEEILKNLNF